MNKGRIISLAIFACAICAVFLVRLMQFQLVEGTELRNAANVSLQSMVQVKAARGEILDRYGRIIYGNKIGYSVVIQKGVFPTKSQPTQRINEILQVCNILKQNSDTLIDEIPITADIKNPTFIANSDAAIKSLKKLLSLAPTATATDCIAGLVKRYDLESLSPADARTVMTVRYSMEIGGFEAYMPITICDNVQMESMTSIKENGDSLKGVSIAEIPVRDYIQADLAPQIMGNVGPIYAEEYQTLKEKGYSISSIVGKSGIEKLEEQYLKGTDGTATKAIGSLDNNVQQTGKQAVPGDTVVLTIDSAMQKVAQQQLEAVIKQIAANGNKKGQQGADADAGAVVAIDVKTGDILASVSYPSYNTNQLLANYSSVANAPKQPMYNRAFMGLYPPGSTFKPVVGVAALQTGVITADSTVTCLHTYKFYTGYQPSCLGWHGVVNLNKALAVSCNYFFFDVGRRTGITAIDKYAKEFGLGSVSGIGLPENAGIVAGPEEREASGGVWHPGDTLQTAIGQSDHLYTPLQLASYVATICNNGVRVQPRIVKEVISSDLSTVVVPDKTTVLGKVEVSPENLKLVLAGMRSVTTDGTGAAVFKKYPIAVGGKTGSAEVPKGTANAVFIAFAPYDDPQIAIAVVIEHGWHGGLAANVVKGIFDEYFFSKSGINAPLTDQLAG